MSKIKIGTGGKGKGLADQAFLDANIGCSNFCKNCYAAKTSRLGHKFFTDSPIEKEYDDKEFRKSCRSVLKKGISIVRFGKHSDPGCCYRSGTLNRILKVSTEEGIKFILVTKSLNFDKEIAKLLVDGNHIVHYSLGMNSLKAPCNSVRFANGLYYRREGVNAKFRITEDVTVQINSMFNKFDLTSDETIITPLRYSSSKDLVESGSNIDNFKYIDGFYRPKFIHESWSKYTNICGEIIENDVSSIKCCNCLCGE